MAALLWEELGKLPSEDFDEEENHDTFLRFFPFLRDSSIGGRKNSEPGFPIRHYLVF
jgi:hypothetical protein